VSGCRPAGELMGEGEVGDGCGLGGEEHRRGCSAWGLHWVDQRRVGWCCCRFPATGIGRTPAPAKSKEAEVNFSNFANSSFFFG